MFASFQFISLNSIASKNLEIRKKATLMEVRFRDSEPAEKTGGPECSLGEGWAGSSVSGSSPAVGLWWCGACPLAAGGHRAWRLTHMPLPGSYHELNP